MYCVYICNMYIYLYLLCISFFKYNLINLGNLPHLFFKSLEDCRMGSHKHLSTTLSCITSKVYFQRIFSKKVSLLAVESLRAC